MSLSFFFPVKQWHFPGQRDFGSKYCMLCIQYDLFPISPFLFLLTGSLFAPLDFLLSNSPQNIFFNEEILKANHMVPEFKASMLLHPDLMLRNPSNTTAAEPSLPAAFQRDRIESCYVLLPLLTLSEQHSRKYFMH